YCNFASDVFRPQKFESYIRRLCEEVESSRVTVQASGAQFDPRVDAIYLGGGTPTLLDVTQLARLFVTLRQNFDLDKHVEITVEAAPGTLPQFMLEQLIDCGVNRVSLGVQSLIDKEAASVARLHNYQTVVEDLGRLRSAGITNLNVDLIAGLPHQNLESWRQSLARLALFAVPHASIYMLEVDQDSRLGRELLAGGNKYHAEAVPDEDQIAELYEVAVEHLATSGLQQYELSNFALPGHQARQNLKYWTRQPYLGFGVDAHSMLPLPESTAVRFSNVDSVDEYLEGKQPEYTYIDLDHALEETLFLGLRLTRGLSWAVLAKEFGQERLLPYEAKMAELCELDLLVDDGARICLSPRGRLLSNEVFAELLLSDGANTRPGGDLLPLAFV
ncbi:MAG: radical SAM family heme chaperone HemW, partial [Acidobacteria bacterium]|nr:radical SAM family heme chaperone HemW [Acidobacteriota bacterium]